MKKRIAYLIAFFAMVLGCFLIQKPLFMLYNDAVEKGISPARFRTGESYMDSHLMPLLPGI